MRKFILHLLHFGTFSTRQGRKMFPFLLFSLLYYQLLGMIFSRFDGISFT